MGCVEVKSLREGERELSPSPSFKTVNPVKFSAHKQQIRGVAPAALVTVTAAKPRDCLRDGAKVVLRDGAKVVLFLTHAIDPPPHVLRGALRGELSFGEE